MFGIKTDSGKRHAEEWGIEVRHALYHKDGHWYMPLERFPGAYFDPEGYLLFRTEREYRENLYLRIGVRVHVPGGISRVPGYRRKHADTVRERLGA